MGDYCTPPFGSPRAIDVVRAAIEVFETELVLWECQGQPFLPEDISDALASEIVDALCANDQDAVVLRWYECTTGHAAAAPEPGYYISAVRDHRSIVTAGRRRRRRRQC
jgi:hypothetical protein